MGYRYKIAAAIKKADRPREPASALGRRKPLSHFGYCFSLDFDILFFGFSRPMSFFTIASRSQYFPFYYIILESAFPADYLIFRWLGFIEARLTPRAGLAGLQKLSLLL